MPTPRDASTSRLLQLCGGYFVSYVLTGILVKVFTGGIREPRMSDLAFLVNNTVGSSLLAVLAVLALGWLMLPAARTLRIAGLNVPAETPYIIPSGICTAIIIPGTTLLYTLPISVMVAMVIMRGSVIVVSRLVDAVQIKQGILKKHVLPEENWAVVFALLAVATNVLLLPALAFLESHGIQSAKALGLSTSALAGSFDFVHNAMAMTILTLYIVAYALRLYLMNYFKNTRPAGPCLDNRGFFAIEQVAATATMILIGAFFYFAPGWFGWGDPRLATYHAAVQRPEAAAMISGIPYAFVAFFSVFLFMFKGRTATFAGVVNRLTSLVAGTVATLILAAVWHMKPPALQDWVSLGFILVAVWFLTRAESKRVAGLKAAGEIAPAPQAVGPRPVGAKA